MSNFILTKNLYMNIALSSVLKECKDKKDVCFIDLESFNSLKGLEDALNSKIFSKGQRFLFIGGKGICSELLKPITLINKTTTIEVVSRHLNKSETTFIYITNYINSLRTLTTLKEIQIHICVLIHHYTIREISEILNISLQKTHQLALASARALNLKKLKNLKQYIKCEYTPKELIKIACV